jgi:hypothetical protein
MKMVMRLLSNYVSNSGAGQKYLEFPVFSANIGHSRKGRSKDNRLNSMVIRSCLEKSAALHRATELHDAANNLEGWVKRLQRCETDAYGSVTVR